MAALASPLVPELIEVEILIRLPVKSLVRFRSVCKLWNSLICDPNFIQNHFNRNNNNGFIISPKEDEDDDYLIVHQFFKAGPYSLSIISHHNFIEFPIIKPPYSSSDDQRCLCLVGSINGLVCIADYITCEFIILWNPAIHCFKKIIIPAADDDEKRYRYLLGFGWDSSANNYKVIAKPFDSKETALYSCNADNWSNHKAIDFGDAYYSKLPCVIVRGITYWKCKTIFTNHVLKFDVTNNQFNILDIIPVHGYGYSLINLNDHLSIIDYTSRTGACVYCLDDEQNCIWSKLYTVDTTISHQTFMCCFNYGGDFVFNGMNNLYDPKSKEIKSLRRNKERPGVFHGFSYTPSMLSLQGMKPLGTSIYESLDDDEVYLEDETT